MHDAPESSNGSTGEIRLTRFHSGSAQTPSVGEQYVHYADKIAGQLQIFQVGITYCVTPYCCAIDAC